MPENDKHDLWGVGWDVRGWRSRQQATAVACLRAGETKIEWLGHSDLFAFADGSTPDFMALTEPAVGKDMARALSESNRIAIAIDAPLAFPIEFLKLLKDETDSVPVAASEIENPLAYRACERWIKEKFNKKPLSASFDKLGNNASLALAVVQNLHKEDFLLIPQKSNASNRAVIEVYPGIVKTEYKRNNPVIPSLTNHIPDYLELGSDEYDAAICALHALLFLGAGHALSLPDLTHYRDDMNREEGWIYTLPPDFIKG